MNLEVFQEDIPSPNFIIFSGRGLVCIWLIEPVPYQALPLWKAVQNYFYERLEYVGADRHRNRVVLLTKSAEEYLQKYLDTRKDDTEFLFVTERKPYRMLGRRAIQDEISNIAERTNINKKITPVTFRHTFAKTMLDKGHSMHVVQTLLGNKEYTSTSETYLKTTKENINKILRIQGKLER